MFSAIFGKRRSSPVEDESPPIPGARSDDEFILVDPASPRGSLYPNVSGITAPTPQRPAPSTPLPRTTADTFHYLQGVPFSMCKELQMVSNKDAYTTEIGDLLAFLTNRINMNSYDYDFSVERGVLKEY